MELNRGFRFSWKFDWDELAKQGLDRLAGYIIKINIDLTEGNQIIEQEIVSNCHYNDYRFWFEYSLIPHYTQIEEVEKKNSSSYQNDAISVIEENKNNTNKKNLSSDSDEMLLPSEQNDTILVIDGKKVHVNRSFLSHHSEYFRTLFSSNDNDGQVNEYPIEGISVDDFNLLLGSISPKPTLPNDKTVEKLLELAARFKLPTVIHHCENHLLNHSKIENEKMMWMGEKFGMSDLLEKSILELNTMEEVVKWRKSPEYPNFSLKTQIRVIERFFCSD